ncbi:MAG TPA: hypothetical protein VMF58_10360 [Rhizomicrobium sp.]|nr:hypothetical protein [Rhizomicrobium sp.]
MNILKCMAGVAFLTAAFVLPAHAQAGGYGGAGIGSHGGEEQYGSPHDMPHDDVAHPVSIDAGSRAEDLRLKGKCDQALPLLRGIIDNGGASEIAQFNLGLCLLDLAAVDKAHADDMRKEATQWIVSAADAGLARAQSRAVTLLLDANPSDPVEAQKWALLYKANPTRYSFGLKDLPDDLLARLDKTLTGPQRVEARKRANAWMPRTASAEE